MTYNWQQKDWPSFHYQTNGIGSPELSFGMKSGQIEGLLTGLSEDDQINTIIEILVSEAIKTSEIEGEFLSRQEVMSSIKKNLGVHSDNVQQVKDLRAKGIALLMVNVRKTYKEPLSSETLFDWHKMLMMGNSRIDAGQWRTHTTPMQVVSGSIGKEVIHFEAPPSDKVPEEMNRFITWFNDTSPGMPAAINNTLIRSAITHLYFETIHPFEDGNGRIGRALSEKALSQGLGQPVVMSLSSTIETHKKDYYNALKMAQRSNEITAWIDYFIETVLKAQEDTEKLVRFSLMKTKFFDRFKDQLNERQIKVIHRMLQEGPGGFAGGMTAKKYIAISKASKATATRDLQALTQLGIFNPKGGGRSVHYELRL